MHEETHFAKLAWPALQARLAAERALVLLFPVGATEPHGPHAPLATDMIISMGICERVARALQGDPEVEALILPPLPFGVTRYTRAFPGPIHISEETLLNLVVDASLSLQTQGFEHIFLVNNHFEPEHVQTLHRAMDEVVARGGRPLGYLDLTRRARAKALTSEFKKGECHAGCYETSLVLAQAPDLVNEPLMRELPYVPVNLVEVIGRGLKEFKAMGLIEAYNGSPAEATREEGENTFALLTEMTIELIRALVRGSGGRDKPGFYGRVR